MSGPGFHHPLPRYRSGDAARRLGPRFAPLIDGARSGGIPAAGAFDEAMMRRAMELAQEAASLGDVPVGAVVFDSITGAVLGEGLNRREADADPTAHAEVVAVRAAAKRLGDWRLNGCTLAVTLEPCAMCAGAIVNARVGRVVFAASDPKAGCAGSLMRLTEDERLNHRVRPIRGVLGGESAEMLRAFFRARRG